MVRFGEDSRAVGRSPCPARLGGVPAGVGREGGGGGPLRAVKMKLKWLEPRQSVKGAGADGVTPATRAQPSSQPSSLDSPAGRHSEAAGAWVPSLRRAEPESQSQRESLSADQWDPET